MNSRLRVGLAALGSFAALWTAWGLYVTRSTERVPAETVGRLDDIELRRYPQTVLVETTAPTSGTAFRRLFSYISGANESSQDVEMTAPVVTDGATVEMTAPVRTLTTGREATEGDGVTMAFYLPSSYTAETAPVPTDARVRLIVDPARTAAVNGFRWYATDDRVERAQTTLEETLSIHGVETFDDPALLQYNDPWTPPFLRTNEVSVTVDETTLPEA